MGINVPSSNPITLSAVEANSEYFQTFTIADFEGTLIDNTNPLPVHVSISGYSSIAPTYQGTVVPIGGVYINDSVSEDFTEMVDGELATVRVNSRRAIMTASDGQVTVLNNSLATNFHDVSVASGEFLGVTVPAYAGFFTYTNQANERHVYIPISRSGFKRLNLYFKHSLLNDSTSTGAVLPITISVDFGQFDNDFPVFTGTVSGIAGQSVGRAFVSYTPTASGVSFVQIPAFDSPIAGVFVTVLPTESVTGGFEIYASKSA
jgi:hypothetical protein